MRLFYDLIDLAQMSSFLFQLLDVQCSVLNVGTALRLGRNFLKGELGDAMNAILCGAGHNLRKILNQLRVFAPEGISTS